MSVTKVAVLGATGQQGGAVAASLAAKGVSVVAITRNPESAKAKELASKPNTEVRKADLNDVASLVAAFQGCDSAFVIANFWECGIDMEYDQYKNIAEAIKTVGGMKHVVMSTLEETTIDTPGMEGFKVLHEHPTGAMHVPHFDGKARAEKLFADFPMTYVVTSCYLENFTSFFAVTKQPDDTYTFTLPLGQKTIPWTILADLGTLVAGVFARPDMIGKRVGQASFCVTGDELAAILSKGTGKTIKYNQVPWETFAAFGFPGADELAQMFEFWLRTHDKFVADRSFPIQKELMGSEFTDPAEYVKTLPIKWA